MKLRKVDIAATTLLSSVQPRRARERAACYSWSHTRGHGGLFLVDAVVAEGVTGCPGWADIADADEVVQAGQECNRVLRPLLDPSNVGYAAVCNCAPE